MTCHYCDKPVEKPKQMNICEACFDERFVVKHVEAKKTKK